MSSAAQTVIAKCGGHNQVARLLGISVSRVYRWTYPRERGGTGGYIPARHQEVLLTKANAEGLKIDPADFFSATFAPPEEDQVDSESAIETLDTVSETPTETVRPDLTDEALAGAEGL